MSFDWSVKTEEEAKKAEREIDYKDGDYEFEVYKAEEKISASGNNYILLKKKVTIPGEGQVYNDDMLVNHKNMFFKRKHFWESVGFPKNLNEAHPEAYEGKRGVGRYIVETYYSKKYGKEMKKLVCDDYVSPNDVEDDIPF